MEELILTRQYVSKHVNIALADSILRVFSFRQHKLAMSWWWIGCHIFSRIEFEEPCKAHFRFKQVSWLCRSGDQQ